MNNQQHPECLTDGELRTLIDLDDRSPEQWQHHLAECPACQLRLETLRAQSAEVSARLDMLEPDIDTAPDPAIAWQSFQRRNRNAEAETLQGGRMTSIWSHRAGRLATAAVAVLAVALVLAISPMRSVASDLFNRYEVEKFEAVTIDLTEFQDFGGQMMVKALGGDMDAMQQAITDLVELDSDYDLDHPFSATHQYNSIDEVEQAYGEDVLTPTDLPEGFDTDPEILMSDAGQITVNVNNASLQTLITELNLDITALPDAETTPTLSFTLDVPKAVGLNYVNESTGQHVTVAQLASPTLTTPAELDMDALRDQVLDLPGLPESLVDQLKAIDDWQHTLIVPVPEGATSEDVTINGEPGLLISADDGDENTVVLWEQDGLLRIVVGNVTPETAIDLANSMK